MLFVGSALTKLEALMDEMLQPPSSWQRAGQRPPVARWRLVRRASVVAHAV